MYIPMYASIYVSMSLAQYVMVFFPLFVAAIAVFQVAFAQCKAEVVMH